MASRLIGLVLAAGKGSRFKSEIPKVLHPLLGKPILRLVLDAVQGVDPAGILVVAGPAKDRVAEVIEPLGARLTEQKIPKGTAHAVQSARRELEAGNGEDVLVVPGDMPLVRPDALRALVARHRRKRSALTVMSAVLDDPSGFGRIVRRGGGRWSVVEEREANAGLKAVREVNASIYVFRMKDLLRVLPRISRSKTSGEYYLTEAVRLLSDAGRPVDVCPTSRPEDIVQVNTRFDLARAGEALRLRKFRSLAGKGVSILCPSSTWIDLDVEIGPETVLYPSIVVEGRTKIGKRCRIYPGAHLLNARLGNDVRVLSSSVIEEATLEDGVQVGPFSRLRPGSVLRKGARVGNFVEMKNTDFGRNAKALHLTYLGDSEIGEGVNVGAGTITCNYDGRRKNRTVVEAGAFIGSGTELIAPVTVGRGAYVAAGSTITKDVPPDALAVARARQRVKPGWAKVRRGKSCAGSSATSDRRASSRSSSRA